MPRRKPVEIPWPKIPLKPGRFEVPCERCGRSRAVEKSHCHAILRGVSRNVCLSCSVKENRKIKRDAQRSEPFQDHPTDRYVKVKCECGNEKWLLSRTVQSYRVKGIKIRCNECVQTGKVIWRKPLRENLPCAPAPACTRCHGLWEDCELYDDCLTVASARGWKGWICTSDEHHSEMEYCEIIDSAMIREAFGHSVLEGFTPDLGYGNADSDSWLQIGYGGSKPARSGVHA